MTPDELAGHWIDVYTAAIISDGNDPLDAHDDATHLADKAIDEMTKRHAQWMRNYAGVP